MSSPLESVVLVELLAQSTVCLCVVTDNVEETIGICEHGLQVVVKVRISRSDHPQLGSSGRMESVEEGAIDISNVEFTLVHEVRNGGVENFRCTRGAKEPKLAMLMHCSAIRNTRGRKDLPRIALTGVDTIVNILDVSSKPNTPESLVLAVVGWPLLVDGMQDLHLVDKHLSTSKDLVGPRSI